MKHIQLEITAEAPLSIGRQKPGGSVSEAENYIPGSVIRGAIAGRILQQANLSTNDFSQSDNDFRKLFLDRSTAIFNNAYPALGRVDDDYQVVAGPIWVLPATALSSKTEPGFMPKGNGVFDTLIDRYCAEAYNHLYDPNCPQDGGRVEPYSGFYSKEDNQYGSHSVEKRLLTRVGINRRRSTAEDQVLYSIEVLNEVQGKKKQPVIYSSFILVEDDLAEPLASFINRTSFRLGGSASRGLGKVKISANIQDWKSQAEVRIKQFNKALEERWRDWRIFCLPDQEPPQLPKRTFFTVNLQSDTILAENWQRTTVISPEMLCQFTDLKEYFLKLSDEEKTQFLELEVAYSSYDYRSGWNSAWGLMKDVELVTNKGSVYLFSTNDIERWYPTLKELEITGVGDRTTEGFGQVQICQEFHQVFRERAV